VCGFFLLSSLGILPNRLKIDWNLFHGDLEGFSCTFSIDLIVFMHAAIVHSLSER